MENISAIGGTRWPAFQQKGNTMANVSAKGEYDGQRFSNRGTQANISAIGEHDGQHFSNRGT